MLGFTFGTWILALIFLAIGYYVGWSTRPTSDDVKG